MVDHVTVKKFAELTGYTAKAINNKVHTGALPKGVWIKSPDNRILISQRRFDEWATSEQALNQRAQPASRSVSRIGANDAASVSSSSPRPLI